MKQHNLVLVKGQLCPAPGKVTVDLPWHWPCIMHFSGLSVYRLTACVREMSTPTYTPHRVWRTLPKLRWSDMWTCAAAAGDRVGRGGTCSFWARPVPPQELWHGLRVQGLPSQGVDDQRNTDEPARPRQGVAQVRFCARFWHYVNHLLS